MLRRARLLTLVGPGGCGKTRLALELARSTKERRVVWVDLAPIRDREQAGPHILKALGPGREDAVLVVLDNCEHVLTAAAEAAGGLLRDAPAANVLATSREPLRLDGELVWRVPGLAIPGDEGRDPLLSARVDAVRLFIERARLAQHDLTFDAATAGHVVEICRALDGMPLALELAAARMRHFSIASIAELLGHPLQLLSGGADARHGTIRATLDWSTDLLSDSERALLRRLSVFAGVSRMGRRTSFRRTAAARRPPSSAGIPTRPGLRSSR